jgi:hypothetical protein
VKQVTPQEKDPAVLSQVADELMGRQVSYTLPPTATTKTATNGSGPVTGVKWADDGTLELTINGKKIPYRTITSIGIPAGANAQ